MFITIMKTILIYLLLLVLFRLMGKREISKLSPFDLVVAIMIAELAALPLERRGTEFWLGVIAIIVLVVMEVLLAFLSLKSNYIRRLINGYPAVLIKDGKVNYQALKKTRYNINDLLLQLRNKDVFNLKEVKYAILENNGDLNVVKKSTKEEFQIPVIIDGKFSDNIKVFNLDQDWLEQKIEERDYFLNDILLATYDEKNGLVIVEKR